MGDIESAVQERYSGAALAHEPGLCCPVDYDRQYLAVIPSEVLERDYGCGDPVSYVRPGETVLDLGSGGGKVCFIAAQITGPQGQVIGIDLNDEMLALASNAQPQVSAKLGYDNVTFRKGRIEDLALDLTLVDKHLANHGPTNMSELRQLEELMSQWKRDQPLVPDRSVDVVISNCVLNLVSPDAKRAMFSEIHRVLKPGGRAVISDIVSDRDVPQALREDPRLWSGCYSGALREDAFLDAFAEAGLHGVTLVRREHEQWKEIDGIVFGSVTVVAYRAPDPGLSSVGVLYKGPFRRVQLDSGEILDRGRTAMVNTAVAIALEREPYIDAMLPAAAVQPASTGSAACGPACEC